MELSRIDRERPWSLFKWVNITSVFYPLVFVEALVCELGWTTREAVDPSCDTWSRTRSTPFLLGKLDTQMGNEEANDFTDWENHDDCEHHVSQLCRKAVEEWAAFQRETESTEKRSNGLKISLVIRGRAGTWTHVLNLNPVRPLNTKHASWE